MKFILLDKVSDKVLYVKNFNTDTQDLDRAKKFDTREAAQEYLNDSGLYVAYIPHAVDRL